MMAAIPALQSPPNMVDPSDRTMSPSTWGLMLRPGSTVSMWAESIRGLSPSSEAMRLPCASLATLKPSVSSRSVKCLATSSSSSDGLSILTSSQNVLTKRSWLIIKSLLIALLIFRN